MSPNCVRLYYLFWPAVIYSFLFVEVEDSLRNFGGEIIRQDMARLQISEDTVLDKKM